MFHSTRGKTLVSSAKAILDGLALDGGLYVLDEIPLIDYKELIEDDYRTLASKILCKIFTEFSYEEVKKEIDQAYSTFDIDDVVKLKEFDDSYFLELFHGPTLAFKDLALVVLPRLMKLSKQKLGYEKNITILTATSGDTGGAALNGFKNVDGVSIIVLYPDGGVSPIQEAQMCSFRSDNARVIAINGNFDDCQNIVKQYFNEHKELSLSSANSINIARLAPQIVYYFYSYIYLLKNNKIKDNELINFVVPTGNFGNIFAGFYAKMMGLPINNLVCSSNKNSVLTDYFNSGIYDKNREFYKTNSPSMDILISSNLERLIYYSVGEDTTLVNKLFNDLKDNGKYFVNNPYSCFKAYSTNEEDTLKTIKSVYEKYNYLIDPHTAVAYNAYLKYLECDNIHKTVIVSTASPFKFPNLILEAFNIKGVNNNDAIKYISNRFNLDIPIVLNYPKPDKILVDKLEIEKYITDVIRCLE